MRITEFFLYMDINSLIINSTFLKVWSARYSTIFLLSCPAELRRFTKMSINSKTEYLKTIKFFQLKTQTNSINDFSNKLYWRQVKSPFVAILKINKYSYTSFHLYAKILLNNITHNWFDLRYLFNGKVFDLPVHEIIKEEIFEFFFLKLISIKHKYVNISSILLVNLIIMGL